MEKQKIHFNLIFRSEPEGGFTVSVPALPGCISYGRTLDEAREKSGDAIVGYIKSLQKHGEEIPHDEKSYIASFDFDLNRHYASSS